MLRTQISQYFSYRKDANYLSELQDYMMYYNRIACPITAVTIVLGGILDWFNYQGQPHASYFFYLRLIAAFIVLASLPLSATKIGKAQVKYLIYFWIAVPQIMLCYMVFLSGAEKSTYCFALTIALAGLAFILPISIVEALLFGVFTLAAYFVACFYSNPFAIDWNYLIGNTLFLIIFILLSILIAFFNEIWRWEAYQLKQAFAKQNAALGQSNHQLAEIKGQMIQQEKMCGTAARA
jgi:two-component system sensor histidine kinase PhcS